MRILITIPHYFNPKGDGKSDINASKRDNYQQKLKALTSSITSLHKLFGKTQYTTDLDYRKVNGFANNSNNKLIEIIIFTIDKNHILDKLPIHENLYTNIKTKSNPELLGYECHKYLSTKLGNYDYYCYLEDDLIIHDPLFFNKLSWFNEIFGNDKLLQPNRYEVSIDGGVCKAYIDGYLSEKYSSHLQDINNSETLKGNVFNNLYTFQRTNNPHSGCFFLNQNQMNTLSQKDYFLDTKAKFITNLESAATVSITKSFKVYKTSSEFLDFFELQHYGIYYLQMFGLYKNYKLR